MSTAALYDVLSSFKDIHKVILNLAQVWGFPEGLHQTVGTGLSDEVAAKLPIPPKEELPGYVRAS